MLSHNTTQYGHHPVALRWAYFLLLTTCKFVDISSVSFVKLTAETLQAEQNPETTESCAFALLPQSTLALLGQTPVAAVSRAYPQEGVTYTPSETDAIMAHKFTEVTSGLLSAAVLLVMVVVCTGADMTHTLAAVSSGLLVVMGVNGCSHGSHGHRGRCCLVDGGDVGGVEGCHHGSRLSCQLWLAVARCWV